MALFVLVQSVHPAVHLPAGAGGGHCPLHLPLLRDQHEVPGPRPRLCQVNEFCKIFQNSHPVSAASSRPDFSAGLGIKCGQLRKCLGPENLSFLKELN
jgi:hypothetical protein